VGPDPRPAEGPVPLPGRWDRNNAETELSFSEVVCTECQKSSAQQKSASSVRANVNERAWQISLQALPDGRKGPR
jgi:hypothetical protein